MQAKANLENRKWIGPTTSKAYCPIITQLSPSDWILINWPFARATVGNPSMVWLPNGSTVKVVFADVEEFLITKILPPNTLAVLGKLMVPVWLEEMVPSYAEAA